MTHKTVFTVVEIHIFIFQKIIEKFLQEKKKGSQEKERNTKYLLSNNMKSDKTYRKSSDKVGKLSEQYS